MSNVKNKQSVNLFFIKNFINQLEGIVEQIDSKSSLYESSTFDALSQNSQLEFLNLVKNGQSNVWAMQQELKLLEVIFSKMFTNGPINQKNALQDLLKQMGQQEPLKGFNDPNMN